MNELKISRRRLLEASAASVLVAQFGATRSVFAAENWDMPAAYSGSNFISKSYAAFAEAVASRTGGELNITVHPGGSLYGGAEILRAVREGQVPIGARFLAAHSSEAPILGVDTIPFLATDKAQAWKLYQASKPALEAALAERGMMLLFAPVWPPQGLFSKPAVNQVSDLDGVKFRAYDNSTTRLAELLGAVPTKTEASEIAQAFSTGIAEAMIASGAIGVFQKMWDYVDNFYLVNAWLPKSGVLVNLDAFNALSDDVRSAMTEAAAEAEAAVWDEMEVQNEGYNKTMSENGISVQEPSAELKAGLEEIGRTMVEEWVEENGAEAAAVIDAYRAA